MDIQNEQLSLTVSGNNISRLQFKGRHFLFPRQQLVYPGGLKMRGGSHPCFPVFGIAPVSYSKIPQHWLRDQDASLVRHNDSYVKGYSMVGGVEGFPWRISCNTEWEIHNNNLFIRYIFTRQKDDLDKDPPFNLGLHHYWINPRWIEHNLWTEHDLELPGTLRGVQDAMQFAWGGNVPIELEIKEVGIIKMTMTSEGEQGQNQIVVWSDRQDFMCVEQVLDDPINFGTRLGLRLKQGYFASFRFEFFK